MPEGSVTDRMTRMLQLPWNRAKLKNRMQDTFDFRRLYREHSDRLLKLYPRDRAMELAIGGSFRAIGILERELLIMCGLTPDSSLVDVGCGAGRLAVTLKDYRRGSYLGTDV